MPVPWTMRLEPTILAMGTTEVTWQTGMPAFSNSVAIAAPLRVLVPQAEVRITASTPESFNFCAISCPKRRLLASGLAKPEVDMNWSWSLPTTPSLSNSRMTSTGTCLLYTSDAADE